MDWRDDAACRGEHALFVAPAGERPETRVAREADAGAICGTCPVMETCRAWARQHREYGYWGGESEEDRAAAGFRVEFPVGRVAKHSSLRDRGLVAR